MKKFLLIPSLLTATLLCGADLLENGSFETPSEQKSNRVWRTYPAKGWETYSHPQTGSSEVITEGAFDGSRAVRLISKGKKGLSSVFFQKRIPVRPGDRLYMEAMIRGKGKCYFRIFWYDKNGKEIRPYFMAGDYARTNWTCIKNNVKVPANAASCTFRLETLLMESTIDVDAVKLRVETGTILDNGKIKAVINPNIGGGIDSLTVAGKKMDFTQPNQIGNAGGMFTFILPANRNPGEIRFAPAKAEVLEPQKKIRISQSISSGKYAGLEVIRTFELPANSDTIKVNIQVRNTAKKPIETNFRLQSFSSSAKGSFTWPTPDWIQIFHQTGEPLNGLNSIVNDLMRDGWIARHYQESQTTLLFSYDIKKVTRTYNYIVPQFVTSEWYYRSFKLNPGEVWSSDASLKILTNQKSYYVDQLAITNKHRVEEIKPIKMPPPPAGEPLPKLFEEVFPCGAGLGNLIQPECAGLEKSPGYYKMYRKVVMRLARIYADSYANNIGSVHLSLGPAHKQFYDTPDKTHELGEFIRKHRMVFGLGRMMYHRKDTDVNDYKKRLPKIMEDWKHPEFLKFAHEYADRLLYVNTGDEPLPANIEVIQAAHAELKKLMPAGIPLFTILNSHVVEMMPYMPVFYGDFYPIKRRSSSGANPWSVYAELADKVKRAGKKPVWFMPQAFAGGEAFGYDIYAYPTDGELRMMANLALAAGVKGINWYGFTNTGWQWVMKYFHLRYSPLNSSGMPGPGWDALVDIWREIAGTGQILLRCTPAELPKNASIKCGNYVDPYGLYNGPAAKLFALKSPKGMVIVAVNHNPFKAEKITVTLPSGGWDLTALKPLEGTTVTRTLDSGAAVFFYCGNDDGEIDLVHKGRYRAESARYLVAAQRAAGNNIPVIDPWKFDKLPGRAALAALNKEFAALNAKIAAAPLGKALKTLTALRRYLGKNDFELVRNLEFLISRETYNATGKYRRYAPDPDKAVQQLKEAVIDDFRDTNKITDYLDYGGDAAKILPELTELDARARRNMEALLKVVEKRRGNNKPDDLRK